MPVGFTQANLQLQIPLLKAFQAGIQAPRQCHSPRAQCTHLTAQLINQLVGAITAGSHEGKKLGLGDRHQAKAGIQGAANTFKGGEGAHHKNQINRQLKGLPVDQGIQIAREAIENIAREGRCQRVIKHHAHQAAHRTGIDVGADHPSGLQLLHQTAGITRRGRGHH